MNYPCYVGHPCAQHPRLFGRLRLWLVLRYVPALVLSVCLLLLLAAASVSAAHSVDIEAPDLNGVGSGHLLMRDETTGRYLPAWVHDSKVHFDITGMIATVRVEQTFRNTSDRYLEGVYVFPLPDNAAVRHLEMQLGSRRIVGKIKERVEAKKIYQAAKRAGKKASLVEQQRPNLFTNRIANIGPGEEVTVHMEYVQAVEYAHDVFSLRFPMTITPRYIAGTPLRDQSALEKDETVFVDNYLGWAQPTDQVPDADAISPRSYPLAGDGRTPLNPIVITAQLDVGMPLAEVDSPYHDIALSRRAGVYSIRLVDGVSEMNRDFVLNWQPVSGATPKAALFTEKIDKDYYALLMVVPPAVDRMAAGVAREIIFVVDTSGSMGGVSIEQARSSVSSALAQLRPQDYFNVIEFNSDHQALYREPLRATQHNIQRAQEFVRHFSASGGTEMLPALRAALASPADEEGRRDRSTLRQVVFITDGAVGNEVALLQLVSSELGESRLFTVGIGSAPNGWFMRKAAEFGRGSHTHIGDLKDVAPKMAALFKQLERPAAVDFEVDWHAPAEAWPSRIPDLYQGQLLSVVANFGPTLPQGEITVRGRVNGQPWQQRVQMAPGASDADTDRHLGVGSLWARRKIAGLLDQKITGRDEASVRAEVLPLALAHQLLSPYTSFVAVEEVVSRPPGDSLDRKAVRNTPPKGQSPQNFAYPRAATSGPAKVWFGVFCLFLAMVVHVLRRPEVDDVPAKDK